MSDEARCLANEVAEAHGANLLRQGSLVVRFSSGGAAFAAKGQSAALLDVIGRISMREQRIELESQRARQWHVEIASSDDLAGRIASLHRGRKVARWLPEDVGVFAAGALWTYLAMPVLLATAEVEQLPARRRLRRLRVRLPSHIAGHGRTQTLHVNDQGLIVRHDYTATGFGSWARAAQVVGGYRRFDGIPFATSRRVTPRLGVRWPGPTLVWIEVRKVAVGP